MQFDLSHNSDIIHYYYTNYTKCPRQDSIFATSKFLVTFTHSVMVIQVPLAIFTSYCILVKTPKVMGDLKWAMLNVHIWSTFMDVFVASLATPYMFFPAIAGFSVGLLQSIRVPTAIQAFIGLVSIGVMFSSICALFENRSSSFPMNRWRLEKNWIRCALFIANSILFAAFLSPIFIAIPDQNSSKLTWLEYIACPTEEFFTSPVFVLIMDKFYGYYMSFVMVCEVGSMMALSCFFILCTSYYMFFSEQVTYSSSTRKLQKMFFIGNIVQIAVPGLFWAAPLSMIALNYLLNIHNQASINIGVCFISLHGLSSMIVVLTIHRPYRMFIRRFLNKDETRTATVVSVTDKSAYH